MKPNHISLILIFFFLFNTLTILKNPDCPFHVDYIQYVKSIDRFHETGIIDDNVNGKHIYVYLMGILLTPFRDLNLYNGMVFITGLFQVFLIYLFYHYTKSIMKTLLMTTTLTFLTFVGHAETVILSSIFLMLYFLNRNKPYSEFFITLASFIRIDSAIFFLFARKKTAIIPILITFLQWFNRSYFIQSDFGLNTVPFNAVIVFILSYGVYLILFTYLGKIKNKLDFITLLSIVLFLIIFLKTPSQKIFFFPVILSFMFFDFDFKKIKKWLLWTFILINVSAGLVIQMYRVDNCTANSFSNFAEENDLHTFYGIFQPYLDYRDIQTQEPYKYQITQNCKNESNYLIAEDWRYSQLWYNPYKFCLEEYQ